MLLSLMLTRAQLPRLSYAREGHCLFFTISGHALLLMCLNIYAFETFSFCCREVLHDYRDPRKGSSIYLASFSLRFISAEAAFTSLCHLLSLGVAR